MVGTRRTSGADTPSPAPADEASIADKRTKLALKKLNIDAHDALLGDRTLTEDAVEKEVYHYRGAVYEWAPGTKPEWVDGQPKRWKRKSEVEIAEQTRAEKEEASAKKAEMVKIGARCARDETENEEAETTAKKARSTAHKKDATAREAGRKRARTEKKTQELKARTKKTTTGAHQKRAAAQGAGTKRARREEQEEEAETSQPSAKRRNRNLKEKYSGRTKRTPASTPRTCKPKKPSPAQDDEETPINSSRAYDFATVGGHEEVSCVEAARERARAQGFAVDPIGDEEMKRMAERHALKQIMELMDYNKRIGELRNTIAEKDEELREARVEKRGRDEIVGVGEHEIDSGPALKRKRVDSAGVLEDATAGPTPDEQPAAAEDNATPPPAARHVEGTRELTSPSNNSATASQAWSEHPPTPASAANTPATSTSPPSAVPASTIPTTRAIPAGTGPLPTHETINKNGNKERWSLPANMTADDRAEAHIYRGRLAGESRQARRRRIKREMDRIEAWEKVEGEAIPGVAVE